MKALDILTPPDGSRMTVLHLEDSDIDHLLVVRSAQACGIQGQFIRVEDKPALLAALSEHVVDIVLMDFNLPGLSAMDAWADIRQLDAPPPCVIVSGAIGEAAAVAAIREGISDYLHKDKLEEIGRVILRTLKLHAAEVERKKAATELAESEKRITLLARHLQTSLEEERAAISREIHDEIGGALAAIKLDLAWLGRHATTTDTQMRVDASQDMVQQALVATQRIMQNTRPAILDQGLGPSAQWLCEAHSRRTGVAVKLRCELHHENLPDAVRLGAYRTIQETLTNAGKYAPQCDVCVEISDAGDMLTVEITDNGPGFELTLIGKSTGFGLKGLSERANAIGGWLDVNSLPGRGTRVTLTAPLDISTPPATPSGNS
jgi:signal transduction histidine kinase